MSLMPIKRVARRAWVNDGCPDTISDSGVAAVLVYEEWAETILTALTELGYRIVKADLAADAATPGDES
jgi:hypothetical protein